jgi:hypothetical protein
MTADADLTIGGRLEPEIMGLGLFRPGQEVQEFLGRML